MTCNLSSLYQVACFKASLYRKKLSTNCILLATNDEVLSSINKSQWKPEIKY